MLGRENVFEGTLGGKREQGEGGCGRKKKDEGGQEAIEGGHEEDGGRDLGEAVGVKGEESVRNLGKCWT